MKLSPTGFTGSLITILSVLGPVLGCNGGGKGSDQAQKPAPATPPTPPAPPAPQKDARILAEPRSATLTTAGSIVITSLGLKSGPKFTPIDHENVKEIGTGGAGKPFRSMIVGGGIFRFFAPFEGRKSFLRFDAPVAPGNCSFHVEDSENASVKTRIEFTVVHEPQGVPAFLAQRAVTVTAGHLAAFTVKVAVGPLAYSSYRLSVVEPGGGTIEPTDRQEAPLGFYKAPATPGTYHVILTSAEGPAGSTPAELDRAVVTVLADDY